MGMVVSRRVGGLPSVSERGPAATRYKRIGGGGGSEWLLLIRLFGVLRSVMASVLRAVTVESRGDAIQLGISGGAGLSAAGERQVLAG